MRNLILLLLLINVLFFAWQYFGAPADVNPYALRDGARERELPLFKVPLTLGGRSRLQPDGTPTPGPPSDRIVGPGCFQVGPFSDAAATGLVRDRLARAGFSVTEATREGQEWLGHWVRLENLPDQAAAEAAISKLTAGGVPDSVLVSQSPPFAVSLGVFRVRIRADAVATAAQALGFAPTITDRFRSGPQYWVELRLAAEQSLSLAGIAGESGQILRAESTPCVAPAPPNQ